MKVAITDYTFPSLEIEERILGPLGYQLAAWQEKRSASELPELVADADAIITQFAPMNAAVINSLTRAKVIVRYGIGVDNVDLAAAQQRGIPVCNVPDYCIDEVADQTLALLLSATRQILPNANLIREGGWGLAAPLDQMRALRDLKVGVVGFGRIGREVVARLRAFKCSLLVHDPIATASDVEQAGAKSVALRELLSQSDVITLHCPSTGDTRGMINRQSLAICKPGVILINVARGDLVDSDDLTEALQAGHVSAAALDVFAPEPIPAAHPIRGMKQVILASHIASCSVPAVRKLRETAANLVVTALRGERLPNVVNGVSS